MLKHLVRLALALSLAISAFAVAPASRAQALTAKCAIIQSQTVGGYNWSRLRTRRICSNTLSYGAAGSAQLSARTVTIRYSERRTTTLELQKATVHELAHEVEFWTTGPMRAKLYVHVGVYNHPSYFGFNDTYYYNGTLSAWKQSPRERLAESIINCQYGTPNHTGLKLTPRSQCSALLRDFRAALAVTR